MQYNNREATKSFLKETLKVKVGTDFYLRETTTDKFGMTHEKYQQTWHGIKVAFHEYIVHKNKANRIVTINGYYGKIPENISLTPAISLDKALSIYTQTHRKEKIALKKLKKEKQIEEYRRQGTDEYEIVFVKGYEDQWCLAYKVNIVPDNIMESKISYLSCETGEVVFTQPTVFYSNAIGTADTRYNGTKTIVTDSYNGSFRLRENSRNGSGTAIHTMNFLGNTVGDSTHTVSAISTAIDFTDNDNIWTAAEFDNINYDNAALDAHWGMEMTYDYFRAVHDRYSYDNNNATITTYVHVKKYDWLSSIIPWDGSAWDTDVNAIFCGDSNFGHPFVSLDILAHEFGHGVCMSTANLLYQQESGALNEGLSDIWGACVENWATTDKQTWILGEDLDDPSHRRSMSNPKDYGQPDTYHGDYWYGANWCNRPDEYNDYCGVHTNSGVLNYWFYLLSMGGSGTNDNGDDYYVDAIGIQNAAQIVYYVECNDLTPLSDYEDMRLATIDAANSIFGELTPEMASVTNAWHAVGLGDPYECSIAIFFTFQDINCDRTVTSCCDIAMQYNTVEAGASLTLVSGGVILFSPPFHAEAGSHVHASIVPCESSAPSLASRNLSSIETVAAPTPLAPSPLAPSAGVYYADQTVFNPEGRQLSIYNIYGVKAISGAERRISVRRLPAGVYIVRNEIGETIKFTKQF